jgi:hypothetical protein
MFAEDRIIGKRHSHFLKDKLLAPFHLVIGSPKWFTENCWQGVAMLDKKKKSISTQGKKINSIMS